MPSYRPGGSERQINVETPARLGAPDIVLLASGRYLVTWYDSSGQAPTRPGILMKGRVLEADGTPVGAEFTIVDAATTKGVYAHVSARPGGGFLLTYTDPQNNQALLARLYDEAGQPVGSAVTVGTAAAPIPDTVLMFVSAPGCRRASFCSAGPRTAAPCKVAPRPIPWRSEPPASTPASTGSPIRSRWSLPIRTSRRSRA